MLELYYWEPNQFHLKPLIALREQQAEFTGRYFDPTRFEQFTGAFPRSAETRHNREYEGPVLVSGNTAMCGSFFLLEFIAESLPGPGLYPADPYVRYRIQETGQVIGTALGIGVSVLGCLRYLTPVLQAQDQQELRATLDLIEPVERRARWLELIDGSIDSARLALVHQRLRMALQQIEARLGESDWVVGDDYSIADIDVFSMIWTLPQLAPELVNSGDTPRILAYIDRMTHRPAVQSAFAMSRSGRPQECFVPGIEASRWLGL
jgi:glutathione S-transferase